MSMIKFGVFEARPVRFTDSEAWTYVDGEWDPANAVEVVHGAHLLTEVQFNAVFPSLPPLPGTAFE
jgi:hypothetical protein